MFNIIIRNYKIKNDSRGYNVLEVDDMYDHNTFTLKMFYLLYIRDKYNDSMNSIKYSQPVKILIENDTYIFDCKSINRE